MLTFVLNSWGACPTACLKIKIYVSSTEQKATQAKDNLVHTWGGSYVDKELNGKFNVVDDANKTNFSSGKLSFHSKTVP